MTTSDHAPRCPTDPRSGAARRSAVVRRRLAVGLVGVVVAACTGTAPPPWIAEPTATPPPPAASRPAQDEADVADPPTDVTRDPPTDGLRDPATDGLRDPLLWPYPADSIWNVPVGDEAALVPLDMAIPTGRTLNIEEDLLFLSPDAPPRPVVAHDAGWQEGVPRCGARTDELVHPGLPIPDGFTTDPGHHGSTPNHSAAIVLPDLTLFETQPLHVCPDGTVVSQFASETRNGDSLLTGGQGPPLGGSHGGSGMTAFGGTIRLGEWVPGGRIPHTLKVVLDSAANLAPVEGGFRWPASRADRDWATTYGGTVAAARMGALLALPPDFEVGALRTEPARILAEALVRHGAYVVDETGWSTAAFAVEWSPSGRVRDEFRAVWGFDLVGDVRTAVGEQRAFLEDVAAVYAALHVVDDNAPGSVGGAGARLAPPAPPLRTSTPQD